MKLSYAPALASPARKRPPERALLRVAALQYRWLSDQEMLRAQISEGVELAKSAGAEIVFLPELSLSRYPADVCPTALPSETAEPIHGPTVEFLAGLARNHKIAVHGSLFEQADLADGRGLNTAVLVDETGELVGKTNKLHIPVTEGYFEDQYFQPGTSPEPYPIWQHRGVKLGMPTCWDEWFPEVARAYALNGADLLCYPTAIGSEPDHPQFDTEPLWRQTIVGHAIANGLFIVVPNRWGDEGLLNFYGSSFIVDPYGRVLASAAREGNEVLVAEIDLDQRRDWLELFPFFATRRPETYRVLTDPILNPRAANGLGAEGGIPGLRP
jgi:N-carbamoylputrescine amidase